MLSSASVTAKKMEACRGWVSVPGWSCSQEGQQLLATAPPDHAEGGRARSGRQAGTDPASTAQNACQGLKGKSANYCSKSREFSVKTQTKKTLTQMALTLETVQSLVRICVFFARRFMAFIKFPKGSITSEKLKTLNTGIPENNQGRSLGKNPLWTAKSEQKILGKLSFSPQGLPKHSSEGDNHQCSVECAFLCQI